MNRETDTCVPDIAHCFGKRIALNVFMLDDPV